MSTMMTHDPSHMKPYTIWFGIGTGLSDIIQHDQYVNQCIREFRRNPQTMLWIFWDSFKQYIKQKRTDHELFRIGIDDCNAVIPQSLELYEGWHNTDILIRPVFCLKLLYNECACNKIATRYSIRSTSGIIYDFKPFTLKRNIRTSADDRVDDDWRSSICTCVLFPELITVTVDEGLDEHGTPIYIRDDAIACISIMVNGSGTDQAICFSTCKRHPLIHTHWKKKPTKSATFLHL
jgi:hypothetical protein